MNGDGARLMCGKIDWANRITALAAITCVVSMSSSHAQERSHEPVTNGPRYSKVVYPGPDGRRVYEYQGSVI